MNDLGGALTAALSRMRGATLVDSEVLDACLKDVATALLRADVKVQYVKSLRDNVKAAVHLDDVAAGHNKRKLIERAVFAELVKMVDAGRKPLEPQRGKSTVYMFVGLQGNGKTTTVAKYAYYFKRQGFKCAMVCADTFRAGAFDQLKQNASKARIPFYGSYTETDPVSIAREGVARFRQEKKEVILVDTSGRHKQSDALFEEMRAVADAVDPDSVVFVMDSAMGQAAYDQAKAFHDSVDVGTVVLTKLDGHAKGGGALSAVAATKSPIAFIGVGEHIDEFEQFEPESFVQRLLGLGDVKGLLKKISGAMSEEQQEDMIGQLQEGAFPLRLLREQYNSILSMGPMASMMSMLPGMSQLMQGKDASSASSANIKKYLTMMDSMTNAELDNPDYLATIKLLSDPSRVRRICRGSGKNGRDMSELLSQYKTFGGVIKGMTGSMMAKGGAGGKRTNLKPNARTQNMELQQMAKSLAGANPALMNQLGGMEGLGSLMKNINSPEMQKMISSMSSGGMGGLASMMGGLGGSGRKR